MFPIVMTSLGVVAASFMCAMVEAAILSLPLLHARMFVEQKRINATDVLYIKENIVSAVATLVIINNSINIIGSIYIGHAVTQLLGDHVLGWASAILTFVIIIFGEVIPKAIGERFKMPVTLLFAKPVRWLLWVFSPVVFLERLVASPWQKHDRNRVTEEEIKMMIKLGRDSGTVESDEAILINRVFRMNDLRALNIMKPLNDVYMLPAEKTLAEAKGQIYPVPGYSTEIIHMFKAQGLTQGVAEPEVYEVIKTMVMTKAQVQKMFKQGKLQDGKSICALTMCGWL